ncbi:MAG: hypothetical protein K2V38_23185, partial [Gemmataceae bacterium]|nr:hypothetical protein [Gemmataceae bacterium]
SGTLRGGWSGEAKAKVESDFWAYEVGGAFYLITRAGEVFAIRRKADGGLEDAVRVWAEKDGRVTGAVQDVRGGTVYAFGGADEGGWRFAFELAPKPDPVSYRTAKPGDHLREAQDCLAAMRKHARPTAAPPPRPVKP